MIRLSNILVIGVLVLLTSTFWLKWIPFISIEKLKGSYVKVHAEEWNLNSWISTSYQTGLEKSLLQGSYVSPILIKLYNQIDYTFFHQIHSSDGVLGKEEYLFLYGHINTYLGKDKVSDSILIDFTDKLKFVSDTLEKLNKHIVYVQCPGKGSYYSEYFPDSVSRIENQESNYHTLIKYLNHQNIPYLDIRKYFVDSKKTTQYPLFTQTGIHWSEYGMALAMDTLIKYLNRNYHYTIPTVDIQSIDVAKASYPDRDFETVLNLLIPIKGQLYAYPKINFPKSNTKGVKMLLVSDSYLEGLYWGGLYHYFQENSQLWFYNKRATCHSKFFDKHVLQYQMINEVLKNDLIIIGNTEMNIHFKCWGIVDDLYEYFKNGTVISDKNKKLLQEAYKSTLSVKQDEAFRKSVEVIATQQKISYDSALYVKCLWDIELKRFLQEPSFLR